MLNSDNATKPKPQPKTPPTPQQIRDGSAVTGFVVLLVGLIGYDWRLAAVVGGASILAAAIAGTVKG